MTSGDLDFSIVAVDKFIQATRDSGYKGTSSAVAELIDNSLQAGATEILVLVRLDESQREHPVTLSIVDNGCGMDVCALRTSLRFGGSSRFNDREGLGRYGMGLPNSSLSQAKRVTVHSWRSSEGPVLSSYLDIDEIAAGELIEVPVPELVSRPRFVNGHSCGTAVTWTRCDRLDNRRVSTLARKLALSIGRRFRHFLWGGVSMSVNGQAVEPIDPLFLHSSALFSGASLFSDDTYEVSLLDDPNTTGLVRVRFSELPVAEWSKLSNSEKRERGIAKGAGVSIVRGGREVDYGWFFMPGKRRENYDDWWRCEVQFDPILDELFGITHSKQQVRPSVHLLDALSADIESVARALNIRARKAHSTVKIAERFGSSEGRASAKDEMLAPLPPNPRPRDERVLTALGPKLPPRPATSSTPAATTEYRIVPAPLSEKAFFNYAREKGRLVLVLNPDHPFYKVVYKPLLDSDSPHDETIRSQIDLLLLAAARNEAVMEDPAKLREAERIRIGWSDTLATFLNG